MSNTEERPLSNTEERLLARVQALTRQQRRAIERATSKRKAGLQLPTRFSEASFLARLEKRGLVYLGRQKTRLQRLLANCARLVSEHGGPESFVARLVLEDAAVWERQLAIIQGVIAKQTRGVPIRDARPLRIQRGEKQVMEKSFNPTSI